MPEEATYTRAYPSQEKPMLSYGKRFATLCRKHVDELHVSRVFIIASKTLSRTTAHLTDLHSALGDKVVGTQIGMRPHTFLNECLDVLEQINHLNADCIVTLGGGSLSDAAKFISFAHANNATTRAQVLALPHFLNPDAPATPSRLPVILIPTTLSAGEYTRYAGITDHTDNIKYQFLLHHVDIVILSGRLALTTPLKTWLASGVRAIDHCVEALASTVPLADRPGLTAIATTGLRNLVPGLLGTVTNPDDPPTRVQCHLGAVHGAGTLLFGAFPGASHGIGHMLGPLGVAHGETSCVLMTAVHKYNARANAEEQAYVIDTLWAITPAASLFTSRGLDRASADLGDLLDVLVRALGMPRSLKEVGVEGDQAIWAVARNSMKDSCTEYNPVKITAPAQFVEILDMCR